MANAMVALANITLGSAAATVTFGSIPSTYRDLRLVVDVINTNSSNQTNIQLNADTGANYTRVIMASQAASGATSASNSGTSIVCMGWSAPENTARTLLTADFLDSSATDKHKTVLLRSNHTNEVDAVAARWANTSAITSIKLYPDSSTFAAGSTFALYGIVSA
jgi:hypothetical protein